jgi:hypothetical protein
VRVKDLFAEAGLGLRLLTDVAGMDRTIRHVYTTDLPDPSRYLTPGTLVLTGLMWCRAPGDADLFAAALDRAGVAALGAGEALGQVPAEVIRACVRHGIPLIAVPAETSFAAVTEEVGRQLGGDRATAMTRVLGRRRLLLSAVAEGAGLDAMFRLMGRELGAECWLLTGLGRVVGGTSASPPGPAALELAREYLRAGRRRGDLAAELVLPLADGAVAATLGEEVILLVPAPGDTAPEDPAHLLAARIRAADPVVAADRSRVRVTVGVSAVAEGLAALGGALQGAGSARRLAALRGPAAVAVVTSDEVASHELLLATVPPGVLRSFRERLLGPLRAYDDRHRAELLPTLREFLACSGSWNACAATMYVHVNTVRYRIRRIEELTGRDLSRLNDQVDFFLALQIR